MLVKTIKCKQCKKDFDHYTHTKTSTKKYCDKCLYRRQRARVKETV